MATKQGKLKEQAYASNLKSRALSVLCGEIRGKWAAGRKQSEGQSQRWRSSFIFLFQR